MNICYIVANVLSVFSVRIIIAFYQIRFLLSCFVYVVKYVELPCYLRNAESFITDVYVIFIVNMYGRRINLR